jgi:hypothetical protein
VPCLDVRACQVGDLGRTESRLDPLFDDAGNFGSGARSVVRLDMLADIAVGDRCDGVLAPLLLPGARRVTAVEDWRLLAQRLRPCRVRCQRAMLPKSEPTLAAARGAVFEEIDLRAAPPAADPETGQLVIP